MATVAVDIDATLYNFEVPFRQAFLDLAFERGEKEEYFKGGYQSWVEWRSPADVCGIEAFHEALERVHSPKVILAQPPFDHSVEVVNDLAEQHDIFYISNRDQGCQQATRQWLTAKGFPNAELVCTMEDKGPWLSECQYIIDDRPRTLVSFVYDYMWKYTYGALADDNRRKAFGLLYEHNRSLTDIPNIYLAPTWSGLRYYLERKGVLHGRYSESASIRA